tara:strand:+ start:11461 stop:11955 length:495 start_codon:yes stop_codon:yes gene_type:complete
MKKLIIISGLPSAGKSTLARTLAPEGAICTTDDYPGLYTRVEGQKPIFNGMQKDVNGKPLIVVAHEWNQRKANALMQNNEPVIVIPNTNTQRWEFQPYLEMAEQHGYDTERIDLFDAGLSDKELANRNLNGVTADVISRMREHYVKGDDWKNDDPRPPWERIIK